ncbi:MAG: 2'-5' RNA ligase family protein [Endomicrobiales bacterium]|nr:2'-5' RNA ligase family protein [Endomicrobiales bacterium]
MKLAVDIVLLPSEEITDKAIELNKILVKEFKSKITLNKKDFLPHISLAMGVLAEKDLSDVKEKLAGISREFGRMELEIREVVANEYSDKKISVINMNRTSKLQKLHERIMKVASSYFTYDAKMEMLYMPDGLDESALRWINNYPKDSAFESFEPHITLGYGELNGVEVPVRFSSSKLALCHLGNNCTCRKILASFNLS